MENNVIRVLLSYFNEVGNVDVILIGLSFLFVSAVQPLPHLVAQACDWSIYCLSTLLPALSVAISCFQLLYVARFEAVFSVDPVQLGRAAFLAAALLTFLPNIVAAALGATCSLTLAAFERSGQTRTHLDFLAWHLSGWTMACICLFLIAYLGIPLYLRIYGHFGAEHFHFFPRMGAKRYLFILFGINIFWVMNILADDGGGHTPFYTFIFLLTINIILVFQLTDRDVSLFVRRKLFNFLDPTVHPGGLPEVPPPPIPLSIIMQSSSHVGNEASQVLRSISRSLQSPSTRSQPYRVPNDLTPERGCADSLSLEVDRVLREAGQYGSPRLMHDYCRIKNH